MGLFLPVIISVKKAVTLKAFQDLNDVKLKHSKVMHIVHEKFEMQNYLKPSKLTIKQTKFAFHARTRMVRVKKNYGQIQNCPLCRKDVDSQPHLLVCEMLGIENTMVDEMPEYEDLFSDKMEKQVKLIQILHTNYLKRVKMLEKDN